MKFREMYSTKMQFIFIFLADKQEAKDTCLIMSYVFTQIDTCSIQDTVYRIKSRIQNHIMIITS